MKYTFKLQILLVILCVIIGLLSDSNVGKSCELNAGQNGTCTYVKDCAYAKTLINQRQRPLLCEFIGTEPIVCCPKNNTLKKGKFKKGVSKFKVPECTLITLGGLFEPPGMTDRPTVNRPRIFDHGGLPPPPSSSPLPPPLSLLSSLPSLPPPPPESIPPSFSIPLPTLSPLPPLPPPPPHIPVKNESNDNVELLEGLHAPMSIAGGLRADTAEFPHMARLGIGESRSNISWYCGGTLITEKFILTAAHCIHSRYGTINWARLGDSIQQRYEEIHEVIRNVLHPEYNHLEHYHDIALSELKDTVAFNFYINPACVHTELVIPDRVRITVSGWGATGYGEDGSDALLKADLDLFSYEDCSTKYPKSLKKLPRGLDDETQICAGGRNEIKDTCQGDSGGPIQIRGANSSLSMVYSVIGVTSFGKVCGIVNQPGVYVRVYPYLPWIESIVWYE